MRQDMVSEFSHNQTVLHQQMDRNPKLATATYDFAKAFGLKAGLASLEDGNRVSFYTPSGIPAGTLQLYRDSKGEFFLYSDDLIGKTRSSARSGRSSRDAEKITGIISALKKNGENPVEENYIERMRLSVTYAYEALTKNRPSVAVDLSREHQLALLKFFIVNDKETAEAHRNKLQETYDKYLDARAKVKDANELVARFNRGATVICIKGEGSRAFYYVAESQREANKQPTLTNLKRYNTLTESPVAHVAAMARTYAQGQPWYDRTNELGLAFMDTYLDDLDISVGYASRSQGLWVLIPKHAS